MNNDETKRMDVDNEANISSPKKGGVDEQAQADRRRTPEEEEALRREGEKGINVPGGGDEDVLESDKNNP